LAELLSLETKLVNRDYDSMAMEFYSIVNFESPAAEAFFANIDAGTKGSRDTGDH